jgi:hypothetical protein
MNGVNQELGRRDISVELARERAMDRREWRMIVNMSFGAVLRCFSALGVSLRNEMEVSGKGPTFMTRHG